MRKTVSLADLQSLDRLAGAAGIAPAWNDFFGVERVVTPQTKQALLAAMGFAVDDDDAIRASLAAVEEHSWRGALEPVTVCVDDAPAAIVFAHRAEDGALQFAWKITTETGGLHDGGLVPWDLPFIEAREVDGERFERRRFVLPVTLPLGYHRFVLDDGKNVHETVIAVVPPSCYMPDRLERRGVWGLSVQLYGVRSHRNWGVGDFADLAHVCAIVADSGGAAVGLNPLHELSVRETGAASPYSPSSRIFVNTLYLNVEALPGYDRESQPEPERLAALRAAALIDYHEVVSVKRRACEAAYDRFRIDDLGRRPSARGKAFLRYVESGGEALRRTTIFNALALHFAEVLPEVWGWQGWPAAYRDPASAEVAAFAREHAGEVEFFAYLQWQADEQLAAAARACAGMTIGLYRDLAVGADAGGADTWAEQTALLGSVTVGAPPDPLNTRGQNWGIAPFSPTGLRTRAYEPFIALLRANMRHAGALRIDHVMALARLFWIPSGQPVTEGAYVRYPFEEMLGIIALESRRARCMVIGEDLGTVPEGLRERLAQARILSCRLLYFERSGDEMNPPHALPELAMVAVGTHDLPPLGGFWSGTDIDVRLSLGLAGSDDELAAERAQRVRDRTALLSAFERAEVIDVKERARFMALAPGDRNGFAELARAANRYLARSPSRVLMVQLEDVLGDFEQVNVPGTVDSHPNWRRKSSLDIERLASDPRFTAIAAALGEARSDLGRPEEALS